MTERLLVGETITLYVASIEEGDRFRAAAEALGVVCRCADEPAEGARGG